MSSDRVERSDGDGMSKTSQLREFASVKASLAPAELVELLVWYAPKHKIDANWQFEEIGRWFQADTGYMRPGKSYADEDYEPEDRQQVWDDWAGLMSVKMESNLKAALANYQEEK